MKQRGNSAQASEVGGVPGAAVRFWFHESEPGEINEPQTLNENGIVRRDYLHENPT